MKIALIFFGQPRELDRCYLDIFNKFIKNHEVDVYAHLWWEPEMADASLYSKTPLIEDKNSKRTFHEDSIKLFEDLYKPRKIITEKPWSPKDIDFKPYREAIEKGTRNPISKFGIMGYNINDYKAGHLGRLDKHIFNELSQWYSVKKAFSLVNKNKSKYDLFLKFRTDLLTKKKIRYEELKKEILYISSGLVFGGAGGFLKSGLPLSDLAACGSYENMSIYSSFYDHYKDYIELPIHLQQELYLMEDNGINCDVEKLICVPHWIFERENRNWKRIYKPFDPMGSRKYDYKERNKRRWGGKTSRRFGNNDPF